jgi:hypothetical protein
MLQELLNLFLTLVTLLLVDELHAVVVDEGGAFSGVPGQVLEVYRGLSRATNAKTPDGEDNYYKNVINARSRYLWWANDRTGAISNTALNVTIINARLSHSSIRLTQWFDGDDESTIALNKVAAGIRPVC